MSKTCSYCGCVLECPICNPEHEPLVSDCERLNAEVEALRHAVGLATTLHPQMEMNVDDPVGMMKEVEAYVRKNLDATMKG